jgi:methionyl aminopeptidase
MPVTVKTKEEIQLMREAGRILAITHEELKKAIKPGMSTLQLDTLAEEVIRSYGCIPSFLNYEGFPKSICVSINEEVVHGIPSEKRIIREGDIVSVDAGVIYQGYHSDAARTHGVGVVSAEKQALMQVTEEAFFAGIQKARAGAYLYELSAAIGEYAESRGYGVVRDLTGHGIGTHLHEDPVIPNYRRIGRGLRLKPGMTLAVEPMLNMGTCRVEWVDDWTVVTGDRKPSAHYENTILITEGAPEILSILKND